MIEGKPSRTAGYAAEVRAVESTRPAHQRVCYDPLAKYFLSRPRRLLITNRFIAEAVLWLLGWRVFPDAVDEVLVRTRYIDDYLQECIGNGIRQLVILGAGYDCRAYRIEGLKGMVRVFEVDYPATQKVKMEKIKRIFGSLPEDVIYVPIDLVKEKLSQRLLESGYDTNLKTLFIWEGVTAYLTAYAVDETLAFVVNNSGEGSSIIFNYAYQSLVDGSCELEGAKKTREGVARDGEPYTFGIGEGAIEEFLSDRGFWQINNATLEFLKSTYLNGRIHARKVIPFCSIVHAEVRPGA